MCWQSTILNKQIAAEDIPVKKICEIYYPFAVLHSGGAVFYKSPCHSFVYSFSPAEKVNSSGWDTNQELMQFLWATSVEKFDYWHIIYNKFRYFLIENGQIYV